ncbi:VPDSG-CTERM sorting domain-containing protein, partial [Pelagicoccus sp. SDUM812003]|uniref:VPDSG-CTERM sorting domain-containing protein n=1 Tax=Pelagicoccus sp. SDUM812003 TaxID=3041267 RepID=UPI00280EFFC6
LPSTGGGAPFLHSSLAGNNTTGGINELTGLFIVTGLGPSFGGISIDSNPTVGAGSALFQLILNPVFDANTLSVSGTVLFDSSVAGSFDGTASVDEEVYSLGLLSKITSNGAGGGSHDTDVKVPDTGSTVALLGFGLLGLVGIAR